MFLIVKVNLRYFYLIFQVIPVTLSKKFIIKKNIYLDGKGCTTSGTTTLRNVLFQSQKIWTRRPQSENWKCYKAVSSRIKNKEENILSSLGFQKDQRPNWNLSYQLIKNVINPRHILKDLKRKHYQLTSECVTFEFVQLTLCPAIYFEFLLLGLIEPFAASHSCARFFLEFIFFINLSLDVLLYLE